MNQTTNMESQPTPAGLRARADMIDGKLNDSGSCAAHLRSAADEIERMQLALETDGSNKPHDQTTVAVPLEAAARLVRLRVVDQCLMSRRYNFVLARFLPGGKVDAAEIGAALDALALACQEHHRILQEQADA